MSHKCKRHTTVNNASAGRNVAQPDFPFVLEIVVRPNLTHFSSITIYLNPSSFPLKELQKYLPQTGIKTDIHLRVSERAKIGCSHILISMPSQLC